MCNQKNKVRIEIDIIEHKYWATDEDYDFLDLFILDGTEGYDDMRIYVDGKLVDFDDKDIKEEFLDAGLYEKLEQWEDLENLGHVGYHDNIAHRVWEFEVEDFDPSKLSLHWECYDMCFSLSDYEKEDRMLELRYDEEYLPENTDEYDWDEGDFVHIWPLDDDENEEYIKKKEKMKNDSAAAAAYMLFNS